MKYLIVGTGGTGGAIGGFLAASGKDVSFIARGSHLEAIRQNGLVVDSELRGRLHIENAQAFDMESYEDSPDVIFVCVKGYSVDSITEPYGGGWLCLHRVLHFSPRRNHAEGPAVPCCVRQPRFELPRYFL